LAIMSEKCFPLMIRGVFVRRVYSYYTLINEMNIGVAHDIFAKNGLEMEYHPYKERNGDEHQLLRIRHTKENSKRIIDLMQTIGMRKDVLVREYYTAKSNSKWYELQSKIADLCANRQIQK